MRANTNGMILFIGMDLNGNLVRSSRWERRRAIPERDLEKDRFAMATLMPFARDRHSVRRTLFRLAQRREGTKKKKKKKKGLIHAEARRCLARLRQQPFTMTGELTNLSCAHARRILCAKQSFFFLFSASSRLRVNRNSPE